MNKKIIAVYPGTFDPITNGHLDVIRRAVKICDTLHVAVVQVSSKKTLFSSEERAQIIKETLKQSDIDQVKVETFSGLLVDYAKKVGASFIVRGIRAFSDFEYEFQMALMNRKLNPNIEILFMMPSEHLSYVSAKLVKEVAFHGGNVADLVPETVLRRIKEIYASGELKP